MGLGLLDFDSVMLGAPHHEVRDTRTTVDAGKLLSVEA
jgi:hypothetical protein